MTAGVLNDLTGQRFGKLVVMSRSRAPGKRNPTKYWCRCDCGNGSLVQHANLQQGATTSCGCHRRAVLKLVNVRHGKSHTPTWNSWMAMKDRCLRPSCSDFPRYGGRGIAVCARWQESFENFLADMGLRPPGTTIERKENNGNYEPGNCIWGTQEQQNSNKRNNRYIEFSGKRMTLAQWARHLGLSSQTLHIRLEAWPLEKALTKSIRSQQRRPNA